MKTFNFIFGIFNFGLQKKIKRKRIQELIWVMGALDRNGLLIWVMEALDRNGLVNGRVERDLGDGVFTTLTPLTGDNEGLPLRLLELEDESSTNWKLPLEDALL